MHSTVLCVGGIQKMDLSNLPQWRARDPIVAEWRHFSLLRKHHKWHNTNNTAVKNSLRSKSLLTRNNNKIFLTPTFICQSLNHLHPSMPCFPFAFSFGATDQSLNVLAYSHPFRMLLRLVYNVKEMSKLCCVWSEFQQKRSLAEVFQSFCRTYWRQKFTPKSFQDRRT